MIKKIIYKLTMLFSPKNNNSNSHSKPHTSIYDLSFTSIEGNSIHFSNYKNKNILIVNTASECGYTPQYIELEELSQHYKTNLVVLGFPSNNFGGQEPASNIDIGAFCQKNYGVTFQLFQKSDVIASNQNKIYKWLTTKNQNGWNEENPKWNFCKYLIDKNGMLIQFYSSAVNPLSETITKHLQH